MKPTLKLPPKAAPSKEELMALRALEDSKKLQELHKADYAALRRSAGFTD